MPATPDAASGRLIFLHGFTQTHHHWHRCALLIARALRHPTLAFVDLPGHGLAADDTIGIADAARPLVDLAGQGTYVGYSMGGRFALHAAVAGDARLARLVLIGATAGIDDVDERRRRRHLDEERAARVESIGVERFVDEWLDGPLFSTLPASAAGRDQRLANAATGLARSLRTAGTGVQESLWNRIGDITVPVLVIAGEGDEKFTAIGRRLAHAVPQGTFSSIESAGHAAHAEQPEATADVIADWLARSE